MNLDINFLIDFMKKYTTTSNNTGEIGEQETADAGSGGESKGATPQKVWSSGRVMGKTYMGDPKYKWESGRVMGKTYMGDPKYKWVSGVTRGHANPASDT